MIERRHLLELADRLDGSDFLGARRMVDQMLAVVDAPVRAPADPECCSQRQPHVGHVPIGGVHWVRDG